jgi:hypothetical protein
MNHLYSDIITDDEEEERIQETIYSDISSDIELIENNEMVNMINAFEAIEPLIMVEIVEQNVVESVEARVQVEDSEAIVPFEIFETNESNDTTDQVDLIEMEIKIEISIIEISSSSSSGGEEFEVESVVAQRQGKTEIEYLIHLKGILGFFLTYFKYLLFEKVTRMKTMNE